MKPNLLLAVCLAGLLLATALIPCANGQPVRAKGTVLLLYNDRAIAGDIERVEDGYLVQREGELWLPARQVKCLCADWNEALHIMHAQANLQDPDERLRLAKWCEQNGLFQQAIVEAKQALEMRPKHAPTQQYLYYLEHAAEMATRPAAPVVPKKNLEMPPSLDLSADALSLFVTKVQPILMNTCVQCHAGGQGGHFQLTRISGIGAAWQRATQLNMAAAVRQIRLENPDLSPLLIKSVSIQHGTANKAPLGSKSSPAYQILREWVETTVATNPHLREEVNVTANAPAPVLPPMSSPPAIAQAVPAPPVAPGPLPVFGPDVPPLSNNLVTAPNAAASATGFAAPASGAIKTAEYKTTAGQEAGSVRTALHMPSKLNPPHGPAASPVPLVHPDDVVDPNGYNNLFFPPKN